MTGGICALMACGSPVARADTHKDRGLSGGRYLPQTADWSLSDRSSPTRAKSVSFDDDAGDGGWSLRLRAVRSLAPQDGIDAGFDGRFRGRFMDVNAWRWLGDGDRIRLSLGGGKVSREAASAAILPIRTRAGFAATGLSWDHGARWTASAQLYQQGGWGGRSLESDLIRMTNGEPAAVRGMRTTLRYYLDRGDAPDEARTWIEFSGGTTSRSPVVGAPRRNSASAGIALVTSF